MLVLECVTEVDVSQSVTLGESDVAVQRAGSEYQTNTNTDEPKNALSQAENHESEVTSIFCVPLVLLAHHFLAEEKHDASDDGDSVATRRRVTRARRELDGDCLRLRGAKTQRVGSHYERRADRQLLRQLQI